MNGNLVTCNIESNIAYVRLNRPDKFNALNFEMFVEIDRMIKALHKQKNIQVVILSGEAGNFSSGLDVKSVANSPSKAVKLLAKWLPGNANLAQRVSIGWQRLPIPVIAVIEGCCFGGGVQIALGADIRIAAPNARLSIMEAKWGLVPDMAGLAGLRHVMSKDQAMLLTMTAEIIDAKYAKDIGLVTEVAEYPHERAHELALKLLNTSPDANAAIKLSINNSWSASIRSLLSRESISQIRLLMGKNRVIAAMRQGKHPDKAYKQRQSWW